MRSRSNILGIQISNLKLEELLEDFKQIIQSNSTKTEVLDIPVKKAQVCITPVNSILFARNNVRLKNIYNQAAYTLCDGVPVKWASSFLNNPIVERITGLELLPALLPFCAENNYSLFLLGASPGVGAALKAYAEKKYPIIKVVGVYSPPFATTFSDEENQKMIDQINQVNPDIVLVSLTAPKQDYWIADHLSKLNTKIAIGIGGAFEVTAGLIPRAPIWMQKNGLEWFYRFLREPKRMFRRYFMEAPLFIPLVIQQKIKGKRTKC